MSFHSLDYESFYIVKPNDTLWKIASEFEIFNSGIQKFVDYLLLMNPWLRQQRNGNLIYPGQIIMLNTPDFCYRDFGHFGKRDPFPTVVFQGVKQRRIENIIKSNGLQDESNRDSSWAEFFFYSIGVLNTAAGGLNLATLPLANYNQSLSSYKNFIERNLELAKNGRVSQASFLRENTRHLKDLSSSAKNHMGELSKNLERSLDTVKTPVGNYAKQSYNKKNVIKIPRKTKRVVNTTLKRMSSEMGKNYKWVRYGGNYVTRGILVLDISLRAKSIYDEVKKGGDVYKETLKQSCGFIVAGGVTSLAVNICTRGGTRFSAKTVVCSASLAGIIGTFVDEAMQKLCYKIGEQIDHIPESIFK